MSTASTSVACDLTLGDDHEIANHICILAATLGDGTQLHPDCYQEKDIVRLCVDFSQVYPEGVQMLLDMKMVLAVQSSSEMMAAWHLFTAAMVGHDEPIRICVHPPMGAEYMALRSRHPSSAHAQIPGGEVVSQSSLIEPQQQFHLALRDLEDAQLRQVMEELQQETAGGEGTATLLGTPFGWWQGPVGGLDADLDDGEVTLQRGGDGDLASQCSSLQAPFKQRGMLVASSAHSQLDSGWVPQELTYLVETQPQQRLRCPLNNDARRYSALKTLPRVSSPGKHH